MHRGTPYVGETNAVYLRILREALRSQVYFL